MSPQEVLLAAADLLEAEGWAQDLPQKSGYCPLTAICDLVGLGNEFAEAGNLFAESIGLGIWEDVIYWNDQPGQTAENVIATLRAAAQ